VNSYLEPTRRGALGLARKVSRLGAAGDPSANCRKPEFAGRAEFLEGWGAGAPAGCGRCRLTGQCGRDLLSACGGKGSWHTKNYLHASQFRTRSPCRRRWRAWWAGKSLFEATSPRLRASVRVFLGLPPDSRPYGRRGWRSRAVRSCRELYAWVRSHSPPQERGAPPPPHRPNPLALRSGKSSAVRERCRSRRTSPLKAASPGVSRARRRWCIARFASDEEACGAQRAMAKSSRLVARWVSSCVRRPQEVYGVVSYHIATSMAETPSCRAGAAHVTGATCCSRKSARTLRTASASGVQCRSARHLATMVDFHDFRRRSRCRAVLAPGRRALPGLAPKRGIGCPQHGRRARCFLQGSLAASFQVGVPLTTGVLAARNREQAGTAAAMEKSITTSAPGARRPHRRWRRPAGPTPAISPTSCRAPGHPRRICTTSSTSGRLG